MPSTLRDYYHSVIRPEQTSAILYGVAVWLSKILHQGLSSVIKVLVCQVNAAEKRTGLIINSEPKMDNGQ